MAQSRHRYAAKPPLRRRAARVALPTAGLLTVVAAGSAVVLHDGSPDLDVQDTALASVSSAQQQVPDQIVSRSAERAPLPNEAEEEAKVTGQRFATVALEVHADADADSPVLATIPAGDEVGITDAEDGDWTQIMHKGAPRWVTTASLAEEMPLGTQPCPYGSEAGLQPDTVKVLRAVCARFPEVTRYGGRGGGGPHATGRALDIMVSSDTGTEIAEFAREHAAELGVSQVIWRQRIWTVQLSAGGWRAMSDRGSPTANHMDHVHVTTYGSSAR